ncbi:hypothetical protein [Hyphomicrobium sp.]|uniref:hypothetical protein n=1 Tax=Hyphomicrobium sp. TaxID=82 RepID=UPI0025BBEC49|nr:hypothetical protein [Hyphomicrobium sp.]MCC7252740.1 hypothetical protein [Hyphomicrobium sp.]
MTTFKSACLALTALLGVATMTATAEARGVHIGGGHVGGHFGHVGHGGHFRHHHFHAGPVFGIYAPDYSYYDDDAYCYRVYRYHHWRTVCE